MLDMSGCIDMAVATAERAAEELREGIVTGSLAPGTPLREVTLAAELGVSRNTLREALRLLATEGLVSQRLHKGAVVNTMSTDRIRDIYLVRRTIELRAVEECGSATPAALAAIEGAVRATERAERAGDWREVGTSSLRFHCAIVATWAARCWTRCSGASPPSSAWRSRWSPTNGASSSRGCRWTGRSAT